MHQRATPCSGDVHDIIGAAQAAGLLPAYRADRLIMLFPAHGFSVPITGGCGYHQHASATAIYAVVPEDCGPYAGNPANSLVIPHEVFEAAADPLGDGWDEAVDGCGSTFTYGSFIFPGPTDNTLGGSSCSTSGYTSKDEIQVYGWSYADYRNKYDALWPSGWRLYSLQSYVTPNNQVRYNAVWRPSGNIGEIQVYGSLDAVRNEYSTLWPQGWRLYILQAYVVGGQVRYNAVWRQSTIDRPL
jgi:Polyglycine hydrolase-like, structural repeat